MRDLREFINQLEGLSELKVVEGANWDEEIGDITCLVAGVSNPPALLFDKVEGYKPGYRVFTVPLSTEKQ